MSQLVFSYSSERPYIAAAYSPYSGDVEYLQCATAEERAELVATYRSNGWIIGRIWRDE